MTAVIFGGYIMVDTATSTVVGDSIIINGNLQGDEDLTVLGRVEGTINLTKTLNIAESGIVKADITVRNAIVSGVVVGNISASDSVEITEAGRMVGDISAPRVIIVDGARFRGAVDMGDLESPRASGPLPARSERPAMTSLTRPAARPTPAMPARRPPPPPPVMARPAPVPSRPPAAAAKAAPAPVPAPVKRAEVAKPAPQPAKVSVPVGGKKKLKKKVVVKKRG